MSEQFLFTAKAIKQYFQSCKERHMADIHFVVLFNGTGNHADDPAVTNVVKMRDGLVKDDKQFVIYRDGIGNNRQWGKLISWFAQLTGWGGGWVMYRAYRELMHTLRIAIADGKIKPNDTLHFSVNGFSRGAALARHFAIHYIQGALLRDIRTRLEINLNVTVDAEYLFDSVAAFGIPFDIWLLTKFGIYNQQIDPGWDFYIPENTRAYHALSVDEQREPFTPKLVDHKSKLTEEVWFDGDHSSVGGGHLPSQQNEVLADRKPLRYMVRKAIENGLRFCNTFLMKHFSSKTHETPEYPLGTVQTPRWDNLPETQRGPRKIYVQKNGQPTTLPPLIAESVIRRMQTDSGYRPEAIMKLSTFRVLKENNEIEHYSNQHVEQLWDSLQQPTKRMAKILRFSDSSSSLPPISRAAVGGMKVQSEDPRQRLKSVKK